LNLSAAAIHRAAAIHSPTNSNRRCSYCIGGNDIAGYSNSWWRRSSTFAPNRL
jgi:hypothetical protein